MPQLEQRHCSHHADQQNRRLRRYVIGRIWVCLVLLGLAFLVGCGPGFGSIVGTRDCSAKDDADVLVVGDSVLAFHSNNCASIPDVLARTTGLQVKNMAQSGAKLSPGWGYIWGDIREQYHEGDWRLVVIQGGMNDLKRDCDCDQCTDVLNGIVSEDGSRGAMPDLVDRAVDDGSKVLLLGYYHVAESARGFGGCREWADAINQRYERVANSQEAVTFVNPSEVMTPEAHPEAYLDDGVHPSLEGSRRIGEQLARALAERLRSSLGAEAM